MTAVVTNTRAELSEGICMTVTEEDKAHPSNNGGDEVSSDECCSCCEEEAYEMPDSMSTTKKPTVEDVVNDANFLRDAFKMLNEQLWINIQLCKSCEDFGGKSEAIANATLSYRHAEDSRMRLGKILEACQVNN